VQSGARKWGRFMVNLINPPVGSDSYPRADIDTGHELLLHTHPLQALWYFVSHLRYQLHCSYQFIDVTSDVEVSQMAQNTSYHSETIINIFPDLKKTLK